MDCFASLAMTRIEIAPIRKKRPVKDNDNLTIERPTFVTHLECAMEGDHYPADQIHNLSKAGKPLLVRYDLAGVKKALEDPAVRKRIEDTGSLVVGNTPEQFAAEIKAELAVYKKVVVDAKLKLD